MSEHTRCSKCEKRRPIIERGMCDVCWDSFVESEPCQPLAPLVQGDFAPAFSTTPTPIDPADIRPGDVVERRLVYKVKPGGPKGAVFGICDEIGSIESMHPGVGTWHLVDRPDPDAEAVEALLDAGAATVNEDRPHDEQDYRLTRRMLRNLRDQGWDVTRRQP